ncbi:hypothetical protein G7048_03095 [Diaphorobacter sp. HDW4B]|uniref:hypothetical protein n=1 Tax=Diaphorobacter sp. HDW4B TaxID=2714925 RepID=UPI001407CF69|nr:hypothetical protein [Diaphorobacter sp. HDW4B]QIL69448.1 hypothetical protein G7048_03095 [Diaphorobacter sp. HDW4B]
MQLPLNFVARQSVWALDNDADLVFLKRASRKLRTLLGLDYSPASFERIQHWLNKQRSLRTAAGREVYDHEADGGTLMLLSFYLAEWIGRSVGSPPLWSMLTMEQGAQTCVVHFSEDRHASLGTIKLPGIVAHAWSKDGADLSGSLRALTKLQGLDRPDQPLPALRPDRDVVFRERAQALDPVVRSAMWSVRPPTLEHGDLLSGYFVEQRELFERGYFTCGGLIQANTDLFKPHYVGLRVAEVLYDPAHMLRYDDLQALAQALQRLSETEAEVRLPPEAERIREHLRSGNSRMSRMLSEDVSPRLFGYPLKLCSIWVDQEHLPDGMLSCKGVPLVIAPEFSRHAKLLPHQVWSAGFRDAWLDAGEARLGKRHAIAEMMLQAREQARQTAVRMMMAEMGNSAALAPVASPAPTRTDASRQVLRDTEPAAARGPGFSWRVVTITMGLMLLAFAAIMRISSM